MYTISKNRGDIAYGIQHLIVDNKEDIKTIPTTRLTVGSTVFVIYDSTTYMLSHKKEWVQINSSNTGDVINPLDTYVYEGGSISNG